MKLYSIKSEVRYTPKMILVKLVGSYTLSQLVIRITDIKRTKMVGVAYCLGARQVSYPPCVCVCLQVRTVNVYYSNKTVQNVIELKNK